MVVTILPVFQTTRRTASRTAAISLIASARMWPTPSRTFSAVVEVLLGGDQLGRGGVQVGQGLVAAPDAQRQGLQAPLAGVRRLGLLLRLERQVEVFEPLGVVGGADGGGQVLGQLALRLDRLEDRLLAFGELAEPADADLDLPDDHLVQVPRPLLAVAGDEGDRVALVEQLDDTLHLNAPDLQVLGDATKIDLDRVVHGGAASGEKNGDDEERGPVPLRRESRMGARADAFAKSDRSI